MPLYIYYANIYVLNTQCHREGWEYFFESFFTITLMMPYDLLYLLTVLFKDRFFRL